MNEPTHIDLFSGVGGFALAAQWAGFRTVAFCEIEPYCQKVLQKNFNATLAIPESVRCGKARPQQSSAPDRAWIHRDIRDLDGRDFRGADLCTGGIPCQPASCAGKRRGTKDDRWLWPQTLRFLGEALPAFVVFENPPGLLTLEGGLVFEALLSQMASLGYEVCPPLVIPAAGAGADCYRYRVFVVAHLGGEEPAGLPSRIGKEMDAVGTRTEWSASEPCGEGLALGEEQHHRQCHPAIGSGGENDSLAAGEQARSSGQPRECPGMVRPETHLELLRGFPGVPPKLDPHRRQRIHALGNAVVPAQVFPIIKAIRSLC